MTSTHARSYRTQLRHKVRKDFVLRNLIWSVLRPTFGSSRALRERFSVFLRTSEIEEVGKLVAERPAEAMFRPTGDLASYFETYFREPGDIYRDGVLRLTKTFVAYELRDCRQFSLSGHLAHLPSQTLVRLGMQSPRTMVPLRVIEKQTPHRYTRHLEVPGVSLTLIPLSEAKPHYGHFLLQRLRWLLNMLELVPELRTGTILAIESSPSYERTALDALQRRHPGLRVCFVSKDTCVVPERLLVSRERMTHDIGWFASAAELADVRKLYMDAYNISPTAAPHRKLYLSRNDRKLRKLSNEQEVLGILQSLDYEFIFPAALTHVAQVEAFSQAKEVFVPSGSALTNVIFSNPGTRVILTGPSDLQQPFWVGLVLQMGQDFVFLPGSASGHHDSFSLDPNLVERALS